MSEEAPIAEPSTPDPSALADMAVGIAAAYVRNNSLPAGDVPVLLQSVHGALAGLGRPAEPFAATAPEKPKPHMPIRKTVTAEHIVSLEDGKPYRTLKRHLAKRGLTPDEYRRKWGLPHDYPMVAPAYSDARSAQAKKMGLGSLGRERS